MNFIISLQVCFLKCQEWGGLRQQSSNNWNAEFQGMRSKYMERHALNYDSADDLFCNVHYPLEYKGSSPALGLPSMGLHTILPL